MPHYMTQMTEPPKKIQFQCYYTESILEYNKLEIIDKKLNSLYKFIR